MASDLISDCYTAVGAMATTLAEAPFVQASRLAALFYTIALAAPDSDGDAAVAAAAARTAATSSRGRAGRCAGRGRGRRQT